MGTHLASGIGFFQPPLSQHYWWVFFAHSSPLQNVSLVKGASLRQDSIPCRLRRLRSAFLRGGGSVSPAANCPASIASLEGKIIFYACEHRFGRRTLFLTSGSRRGTLSFAFGSIVDVPPARVVEVMTMVRAA